MPVTMKRRFFLAGSAAAMACLAARADGAPLSGHAMARVIIDNDFAGDPDGLFQLAHHLLSPSVTIPLIVSSHLPVRFGGPSSATNGVARVRELLAVLGQGEEGRLLAGAQLPIATRSQWAPSPATAAIIHEAMREDTTEPLFYAAGASLTELALAWLAEPRIARRLKLVWIGGNEHPGLADPPPGPAETEFNVSVDPLAAQIIFNESDIEIWQVPRDAYRQLLFTDAELDDLAASSRLARFLQQQLAGMAARLANVPGFPAMPRSEVHVLGDSPLVTLTALMTPFQPDPASSHYVRKPTPHLALDGSYQPVPGARPMRVYTQIDAALTIRDMVSKFKKV